MTTALRTRPLTSPDVDKSTIGVVEQIRIALSAADHGLHTETLLWLCRMRHQNGGSTSSRPDRMRESIRKSLRLLERAGQAVRDEDDPDLWHAGDLGERLGKRSRHARFFDRDDEVLGMLPAKSAEVAERLGIERQNAQQLLLRLLRDGRVMRAGDGTARDPHVYRRAR